MRWRWAGTAAVLVIVYASPGLAQPIDPMEGVIPVPAPLPSTAPPPTAQAPTPPPTAQAPTPPPPPAAPPAPPASSTPQAAPQPTPVAPPPEKRTTLTTFGIGPTYFGTTGTGANVSRPGAVVHIASRIPFDDNLGLGLRFAWGLTEFRRFEDFTRAGYDVGSWTTQAYKDVYEWGATPDDWRLFRWIGSFFAFAVLWIPYIAAGACYLLAPIAPTTYLETDLTFNYDVGSDRAGSGPYFKAGLGLVGYLHPRTDKLFGGLGPTAGMGVRVGKADIGVHGTWLPPILHGDNFGERTSVFIGSLTIGISGY